MAFLGLKKPGASTPSHDMRLSQLLWQVAHLDTRTALRVLRTSEQGLSEHQVTHGRRKHGPNEVTHERSPAWSRLFLRNFQNPFVVVLLVIGAVSYLTGDLRATLIVSVMVSLSVLIRFVQEVRSSKAAARLQAMVGTRATVSRQYESRLPDGSTKWVTEQREVPFDELVPGDLVHLSAGDMIPADLRLLASKDLFVSQAALTGESLPIEKFANPLTLMDRSSKSAPPGNPLDQENLCFMGTTVVSGTATAVIVLTGAQTYFGSMAKHVVGHRALTRFDEGINGVTTVLLRFMAVMVPVIFALNGFVKGDWQEAFLFSLAVAVGLTPEMLPMVVTANLAKGAVAMSRRKVIVKQLNAIQNVGAMDILCSDKTGTLTQDKIVVERYLDIHGIESPLVLQYAYLNSYYQTGLKNLLDRAILQHVEVETQLQPADHYAKIDEIPFDFTRRRMSVIVEQDHARHLLICKGAVEEVLRVCTQADDHGEVIALTEDLRHQLTRLTTQLNEDGLRVIAVAYAGLPAHGRSYSRQDEQALILAGLIAFLDPPKESARDAIAALHAHGVQVKILTGDSEIVARRVCRDVGLSCGTVLLGSDIEGLTDEELAKVAEQRTVFAKLNPMQKARVIRVLRANGHAVGYLGDGINDAPALREADVGISVDTATDIAKESADIILLEKSLVILEEGVLKGREVYGNIIKYIKMTASSNFGNVFSVLAASAFLPFLPMLPIQLLIQNLCYDLSQLSLPWDRMDPEFLKQPRQWKPDGIARFMMVIGPISSIFDLTTFAVMWVVFQANTIQQQALFQSGWFLEGLLSQILIVHMIRTTKVPFLQSRASAPVLWLTGLIVVLGLLLPFTSVGAGLGMQPLPPAYFVWLGGILLSYLVLTQVVKIWYIRHFQEWL